ncbi:hypothetical protein ACJX0J_024243, partial [Zea mays]
YIIFYNKSNKEHVSNKVFFDGDWALSFLSPLALIAAFVNIVIPYVMYDGLSCIVLYCMVCCFNYAGRCPEKVYISKHIFSPITFFKKRLKHLLRELGSKTYATFPS